MVQNGPMRISKYLQALKRARMAAIAIWGLIRRLAKRGVDRPTAPNLESRFFSSSVGYVRFTPMTATISGQELEQGVYFTPNVRYLGFWDFLYYSAYLPIEAVEDDGDDEGWFNCGEIHHIIRDVIEFDVED